MEDEKVGIISYPWYVSDWFNSETRLSMNAAEKGIYRDLLDYCWLEGSLPSSPKLLRNISNSSPKEFSKSFSAVRKCFYEKEGRLFHRKVDDKRKELITYRKGRIEAGRKGGLSASSPQAKLEHDVQAKLKPSPPSPSSSSTPPVTEKTPAAVPLPKGYALDELYAQFREACGWLGLIESDFTGDAWWAWCILDSQQKIAAIAGIVLLRESGADPALVKRPKRWLSDREWTRKPPAARTPRTLGDIERERILRA